MPINPFINRDTPILVEGYVGKFTIVRLRETNVKQEFFDAAPCVWSRDRGATHSLIITTTREPYLYGPTRPARLLKTCVYVGVDEVANDIVWERWSIHPKPYSFWEGSVYHPAK
jgi:hypothetical protein